MILRYDGTEYKLLANNTQRYWVGNEEAYEQEKDDIPKNTVIAITGDTGQNNTCPIGSIIAFAGAEAPNTFLLCDGSAVPRIQYAHLFEVISTLYGNGDGETTFNLPDLRNRTTFGIGTNTGGLATLGANTPGSLPNITAGLSLGANLYGNTSRALNNYNEGTSGALRIRAYFENVSSHQSAAQYGSGGFAGYNNGSKMRIDTFDINASRSSSMYKSTSQVVPSSVGVNYIIKATLG